MRYQPLNPQCYIENRKKVVGEIEMNSLVILTSNSEFPRCGDTTMPFRQNSEMLYLSGIDQEETYLTLAPWHPVPEYREILYLHYCERYQVKNPSPEMVVWFGHRLSKEQASQLSGVKTVMFTDDFQDTLQNLMCYAQNVYLHLPENPRMRWEPITREHRFAKQLMEEYPLSKPFLKELDGGGYLLETEVCRLEGAARFILGLYDDIELLGGEELRAHVGYRVRMMRN